MNSIVLHRQNGFRKRMPKNNMASKLLIASAMIINGPMPELNRLKLILFINA